MNSETRLLERVVGLPGAVLLGLGSILGTGIFVSLGLAAGYAGASVLLAVVLAGVVAAFNGLSSAQLAASHPVSGGTYEYGYRYLRPELGFTAGFLFLCAKAASAATAALGFAGYVLGMAGSSSAHLRVVLAVTAIAVITIVVAQGLRRSAVLNAIIVTLTVGSLVAFVMRGVPHLLEGAQANWHPLLPQSRDEFGALLHATALMFVAYTGYGRIATLGEEVREPLRTIPRAVVTTLVLSILLYASVAAVSVGTVGAAELARATQTSAAPLLRVSEAWDATWLGPLLSLGAVAAMLGVLLNLVLGVSRVAVAMARRRDLPHALSVLDGGEPSPRRAVYATGSLMALLALTGSVQATWSFSAFTVLVYYAITNLAALRLPGSARLYPRWVPLCGLSGCLALAFFVKAGVWLVGLALIALGLLWHFIRRRMAGRSARR